MEGPRDAEAAEADLALHTKLAMHERHVAMRLTEAGAPGLAPLLRDVQRRGQGTSWVFLLIARWVGLGNSMGSEGSTGNVLFEHHGAERQPVNLLCLFRGLGGGQHTS